MAQEAIPREEKLHWVWRKRNFSLAILLQYLSSLKLIYIVLRSLWLYDIVPDNVPVIVHIERPNISKK